MSSEDKDSVVAKDEPVVRSTTTDHSDANTTGEPAQKELGTKRGLSSRHSQLIALGGTIGTGLFVSSGKVLAAGGPAFLVSGYVAMSAFIYLVLAAVTEMAAYLPIPGGTMNYYGGRYVSRSLGYMMGWLYFYSFAVFVPFEVTAAAMVVRYWESSSIDTAVLITILLVPIVALNLLPVKYFGESEFWLAGLKVVTLVGLLILSFILFWGGGPSRQRLGFWYWVQPGATKTMIVPGGAGRFVAFLTCLINSALAFTFSPEMIVVMAGEMQSPRRTVPRVARKFFWRLIVFYIGSALAISVICPSDAPELLNGGAGAGSSPWVIGVRNAGIHALDSVINAVIVTAAWSAGNSILYLSSRSLYSMALEGNAPRVFRRCTKQGVPVYAVGASASFSLLAYMNVNSAAADVFDWLLNLVNNGGFISWICCSIVYIRFHRAAAAQNIDVTALSTRSRLQPIGAWVTLVTFTLLCLLNGFTVFFPTEWSTAGFLSAYVGIPIFATIYLTHRMLNPKEPWVIPSHMVDMHSGLAEMEAEESQELEKPPRRSFTEWIRTYRSQTRT